MRAVILAGGETKNPLTRHRAMPAVPLGSSLLMVDVPLNNCLQAGINKMWVLEGAGAGGLGREVVGLGRHGRGSAAMAPPGRTPVGWTAMPTLRLPHAASRPAATC